MRPSWSPGQNQRRRRHHRGRVRPASDSTVEWEPAFKEIKELSAKFKEVTFTLYGEAFAKSHWVSKAVYLGGKVTEENTLSRIDGAAFRQVYQEIFGEPFSEKKPA